MVHARRDMMDIIPLVAFVIAVWVYAVNHGAFDFGGE